MTEQLPPEDQPPREWQRFIDDDELREVVLRQRDCTTPEGVGTFFFDALEDPEHYRAALRNLTTPESWDGWGDFRAAQKAVKAMPNYGYSSKCDRAVGADDVAYFKVFSEVPQSFEVVDAQPVNLAGVLSIVWRPELGEIAWRVHAFGNYYRPEELPRSAHL